MSPMIEVTGVGGVFKKVGDDRYRPRVRGDRFEVSEEDAEKYVRDGVAMILEPEPIAPDAEGEQPDAGMIDLNKLSVMGLRKYANDRRIQIPSTARNRGEIIAAIQGTDVEIEGQDDDEGDG